LYRNVSTDFFCHTKRFLEIYANERNQRNRTEAAVGFVQHRYQAMASYSFSENNLLIQILLISSIIIKVSLP
jgi:hypothetical protein